MKFSVPQYVEAADGVVAFEQYSNAMVALLPPVGTLMPWLGTGSTAPTGWLLCNGGKYGERLYPKLAAMLGTTGGEFTTPDLRGRMVIGMDPSDASMSTVNKPGGRKTITEVPEHKHDLKNHTHTAKAETTGSDHTHEVAVAGTVDAGGKHTHSGVLKDSSLNIGENFVRNGSNKGVTGGSNTLTNQQADHTHTFKGTGSATKGGHEHTVVVDKATDSTDDAGVTGGVNVLNPFLTVQWIVRAG
jgi:microcystin-dependent protein